jgi:hypothetical protein
MKNLYESILDDEDVLIANVKDTGLQGFDDFVIKAFREFTSRFDKMRKDSKLKNLIFPDNQELYDKIVGEVKNEIQYGKTIAKNFKSYPMIYVIKRKDKKTADELNQTAPRDPDHPKWVVDFSDEMKRVAQYFDKDFGTRRPDDNPAIKIKFDIGTAILHIGIGDEWDTNDNSETLFRIEWWYEYRPGAAAKRVGINTKPVDVLGHPVSDGDLVVGVQRGDSHLNIGYAKMASSGNRVYIGNQLYTLSDIVVLQHNGKSVDMSDVKLKY